MITKDEIAKVYLEMSHKYDVLKAENQKLKTENAELKQKLDEQQCVFAECPDVEDVVRGICESIMKAG